MNAREVALATVRDIFPAASGNPARGAQESLDYRARKAELSPRDRAFATELAYGSIKMRRTLDWYLETFIGERKAQMQPAIREILRLAIYELNYTRADEHATVFEFVNLGKRYGHRGVANLINAVLRSFLRDRPSPPQREDFETDDDYLGTLHSLPTWIVRQWRTTFGERVAEICAAVNDPAQTAITVNARRQSVDAVLEQLAAAGVKAQRSEYVPESALVFDGSYARHHEGPAKGGWWVQSESSAMPVAILLPQPGESVLDVCSGRGNKALQIGARMEGEGTELCIELDARKASVLEERLSQAGITAGTIIGDATGGLLEPGQRFDRILLDAPCSGVGVLGRHPEARWKKQPGDGERLAVTQRALLEALAPSLHEGGALVYAVCSTDPRETIEVVEWFRARHNVERGLIPAQFEPFLTDEGDVLVPPGLHGRDGFYIARLEHR